MSFSKLFRILISTPKEIVKLLIRIYQKTLSADHSFWAQPDKFRICVHYPSCSTYAYEAVDRHGAIWGVIMGFFRVLRCHPYTKHRYDPVPNRFSILSNKEGTKEVE